MMTNKSENTPLSQQDLEKIKEIVKQTQIANVGLIVNVGTTMPEILNSIKIAQACKSVFVAAGIHPCECFSYTGWKGQISGLEALVKNHEQSKIVAIGEIGFDFYHEPFDKAAQEDAFRMQIELALEYKLPIIVHVRNAADELLHVLSDYVKNGLRGVIHCFSQKQDFADQVLEWGFYIGIDGHITYPKNTELRDVIKSVPLDRLLLETDAPFLPPQQFRGKQCHPAFIPLIAEFIADLRNISLQEVEDTTTQNAIKLFSLKIV
jgi:TatD DNase family protein